MHLDYTGPRGNVKGSRSGNYAYSDAWSSAYSSVAAGAALVAGLGLLTYLKRVWLTEKASYVSVEAKLKLAGILEDMLTACHLYVLKFCKLHLYIQGKG